MPKACKKNILLYSKIPAKARGKTTFTWKNERIQAFPSLPGHIVKILKNRDDGYFLVWIPTVLQGKTIEKFMAEKKFFEKDYIRYGDDYSSDHLKYALEDVV